MTNIEGTRFAQPLKLIQSRTSPLLNFACIHFECEFVISFDPIFLSNNALSPPATTLEERRSDGGRKFRCGHIPEVTNAHGGALTAGSSTTAYALLFLPCLQRRGGKDE